ncbi:MAG: hypothetical protein LBG81_09380, partial [Coriobacteriaceae bacterium]|nr:hypothetical protein [Coriobacteriaceae bacterium]
MERTKASRDPAFPFGDNPAYPRKGGMGWHEPHSTAIEADQLASRNGAIMFSAALFAAVFVLTIGITWLAFEQVGLATILLALVLAWFAIQSAHIAQQWEKVVVLRFGRFRRVAGPGLFFTIPVIEYGTIRVDQRVRATPFGAEETLTSDLVPLYVDAVLFWMVWDAEKACVEVGNFNLAVELAAQTALRDAIGRAGVAEITIRRNQLDKELKRVLEEKVEAWGITVLSVEIRDIIVPDDLQN